MSHPDNKGLKSIKFYVTTKYGCGYIENRSAQSMVATPYTSIGSDIYDDLIYKGFRRSGQYVYKPHCEECQECIPIRLSPTLFVISRSQKRVIKKHAHITAKILPLQYSEEHYELYINYQNKRHRSKNDHENDMTDYHDFLIKSNVQSKLIEFRDQGKLVMVTIIDEMENGLSAVYTFYDSTNPKNSLGTFSILWLLNYSLNKKVPYLYLGYWIRKSVKMAYKINFKPYEILINDLWQEASE
ncbi:MAG: arginyltransferase [Nitrosomonadales bacterium]|nr:arginyltransferase [Nitrosomonadales bacterium]